MARVSFMQTSMLGGRWSATAQGRMNDPAYKTALSECLNGYPQEEGSWTKRPGFRYLQHTRAGADAVIRSFDFTPDEPYVLEFTALKLRIFSGNSHLLDSTANVLDISTATPAVVTIDTVPSGWANGNSVIFTLENDPCGPQAILCNRQFTIGSLSGVSFTLLDPITGASIDGSAIGFVRGTLPDSVGKIFELTTPYTVDELDAIRVVSDDSTVLILHPNHQQRLLSKNSSGVFTLATQDFQDGPYLDINDPKKNNITLTLSAITGTVTGTFSGITGINNDTGLQTTDVGRLVRFQGGPPIWDKSTAYHKSDQVTGSDGNIYTAQGGMSGLDPTLDDGTHWTISPAHVNWIWLKIATRVRATVFTATVESDLRDDGTFATIEGNSNIRAAIGDSNFPQLDAKLNQIDFTAFFAPGQSVVISNGAFTDGGGGDISGTYTVRGVWNDPDDNRSLLQFTTDGGQTADWATVGGLSDSRTAYFSPSVGQTLAGDELTTPIWRLGAYSDTDGWPACGAYHETRLWLSGQSSNRIDASKSNSEGENDPTVHFDFTPTAPDGTVAENNAIAAVLAAGEQNTFFWMLSTEYGLVLGSQAGEWLVRASTLDDPLSPSSIQMRRVTTYGCADVDPQICLRTLAFVQRHGRRVLDFANYPWGEAAGWYADNLDHLAQDLTCGGIAELRYQQTPAWNLWMRRNDGALVGSAFRHAAYGKESFNGWHRHTHGGNRIFRSLAVGVSGVSGEGEQLYAVTNQTDSDAPDYNIRWIEVLAPEFDGCDSCDAMFRDGAPELCCSSLLGGTTPTGIRLYGLWHLNGKTIQPFLGGLALGDYAVSNGTIDITFGDSTNGHDATLFTWAYFQTLETCDLFGSTTSLTTTTTVTPPNGPMSLMAYVGADTPVGYQAGGGRQLIDHTGNRVFQVEAGTVVTGDAGIKVFDGSTGTESLQATETGIFGAGPAHTIASSPAGLCYHPATGDIFTVLEGGSNTCPVGRIDADTLTATESFGETDSSTAASTNGPPERLLGSFQLIPATAGSKSYVVSHSLNNEIAVLDVTGTMSLVYVANLTEAKASLGPGPDGQFFATGGDVSGFTTSVSLYRFQIVAGVVSRTTVRTFVPTDIDATWGVWFANSQLGYDKADGNVVCMFSGGPTLIGGANAFYLLKLDAFTGAILWKTAVDLHWVNLDLAQSSMNGKLDFFDSATPGIWHVDLSNGVITTTTWNAGFSTDSQQVFDYLTGSVTMNCGYTQSTGPVPVYLGAYLAAHSNAIPGNRWGRLFSGASDTYTTQSTVDYPFYGSVGFSFVSRGQLLRPDFGQDGGAQAGPAFGKMRRIHKASIAVVNTRDLSLGTDFTHMHSVPFASAGGTAVSAPNLFTGTVAFKDLQIDDNYSTDSRLCWEAILYPATVTALAGSLDTKDE